MPRGPAISDVQAAIDAILGQKGAPRPAPRATAGAIVVDREGRILLGRTFAGRLELPHGAIEEDESTAEAAVRETLEETGELAISRRSLRSFRLKGNPQVVYKKLRWGSSWKPKQGGKISQAAADLLRTAAKRLGAERDFARHKMAWFDAMRRSLIPWITVRKTYHVLALREDRPFAANPEFAGRKWLTFRKLRFLADTAGGALIRRLLAEQPNGRPPLGECDIEAAAALAQCAGTNHGG